MVPVKDVAVETVVDTRHVFAMGTFAARLALVVIPEPAEIGVGVAVDVTVPLVIRS